MRQPREPLLQTLLSPLLEDYYSPESIDFAMGRGGSLLSDVSGILVNWLVFYMALLFFYHTLAPASRAYYARKYPNAPTSLVSEPLTKNMIEVSNRALPVYVTVIVLGELFRTKGWALTCDTVEECGGWVPSLLGCVVFFFLLEFLIFLDHYYLLHKLELGKKVMQHASHHVYKYADQLNAFSGFSFTPQDGWSQGISLSLCQLVVPAPLAFVLGLEIITGFWTLYIHTDVAPLPWPLMGCDYHYIHHRYNWYNFGFMTLTFDTLFGTVKHPKAGSLALSRGETPTAALEKAKSKTHTEAILTSRGRANEILAASFADGAAADRPAPPAAPAVSTSAANKLD